MLFLDNWGLFFAKSFSLLALVLIFLVLFLALVGKAKMKAKSGELEVKSLAEQLEEQQLSLWQETLSKKALKSKLKAFKKAQKQAEKKKTSEPRLFVLNFKGDMQAGEANNLSKEVTALFQ